MTDNPQTKRILLVEDDTLIAAAEAHSIKNLGFDVIQACNEQEAIRLGINDPQIDLILMDIDLGRGTEGIRIAQEILQQREIPIIFLTAHTERNMINRVRGIARYGFLPKNMSANALLSSIEAAFDLFDAHQQTRKIEEKLRQANERLELAQSASHAGIWDWDVVTGEITWTDSLFEVFGLDPSQSEASFETWNRILHPDDRETANRRIERALQEHTRLDSEYRIRLPDGRQRWISALGKGVYNEQGEAVRMTGICLDITERKQTEAALKASEERYRYLFSGLVVGCSLQEMIYNQAGAAVDYYTLDVNHAYETMLGAQAADVVGHKASEILPEAELKKWLEIFAPVVSSGQIAHYNMYSPLNQKHFEGSAFRPEPGKFATTFIDVTERVQAEAELEQRVLERTTELHQANLELKRSSRLKDEFLANMSHELRTPLSSILGLAEVLQVKVYGDLNDRQIKALLGIRESGEHLLSMINNILDLSKMEAGKMELKLAPVNLETVIQACLRMVKQIAQHKQLRLSTRVDTAIGLVMADEQHAKQILLNLLSNAVKFTPAGGSVGVDLDGDQQKQLLHLSVWDTGIGIPEENFQQLFEPFVQLDGGLARQYEGTGLGLTLVHHLVELHGGSISLQSKVGEGSRFTATLPWIPAEPA